MPDQAERLRQLASAGATTPAPAGRQRIRWLPARAAEAIARLDGLGVRAGGIMPRDQREPAEKGADLTTLHKQRRDLAAFYQRQGRGRHVEYCTQPGDRARGNASECGRSRRGFRTGEP